MSKHKLLIALILVVPIAAAAWLSGPPSFDAVDGAEFALCGARMEIPHSPGYPLFTSILHLGGTGSYAQMRLMSCLIAGLACGAVFLAMTYHGISTPGAIGASVLFSTLPPVMSQLNVLEIHGLAILLCGLAIASGPRIRPYWMSMAVFGGHPAALITAPLVFWSRRSLRYLVLAAIPVSLWLFVPLRSGAATIAHYTHPDGMGHFFAYLGMYGGKLASPSPDGIIAIASEIGAICGAVLLLLLVGGRRPPMRILIAFLLSLLWLSTYSIEDISSMSWIMLLPLATAAGRGLDRLMSGAWMRKMLGWSLVGIAAAAGIEGAWRGSDITAPTVGRDMLRGIGLEGIYCNVGHDTFYAAYLMHFEDRRPDIAPIDLYNNFFRFHPRQVSPSSIPPSIGDRIVYASRGWGMLPLRELLFTCDPSPGPGWEAYGVFSMNTAPSDMYAKDAVAECWIRRAVDADSSERPELWHRAIEAAGTDITLRRIETLRERLD